MRSFFKLAMAIGCLATMLSTAQAQNSTAPTSVAVVDIAKILKEHPAIQAQVQKVEADLKAYDAELQQKREQLKAMVEELKTLTVGSAGYAQKEEQIAEMDSKLRLDMTRKRKELVEAEARIYHDNYKQIAAAVQRLAEFNKIDLVLRYNSEEMQLENQETVIRGVMKNVVYHSQKLDITNVVMQMLTQQMAARPGAGAQK